MALFKKKKSKTDPQEEKEQSSYQLSFSKEERERIARLVYNDFVEARDSRTDWMASLEEDQALWEGKREKKSDPWPNCSNVNSMITTIVVEMIHSKLFPTIWNEELIHWRSEDPANRKNTEQVTRFMRAILRRMNMSDIIDDMIHDCTLYGTTAHKVRWEVVYKWVQRKLNDKVKYEYIKDEKCTIDPIDLKDIFFPYEAKNEQTCDYIIHRTYSKFYKLKELESRGYIEHVADEMESAWDEYVLEGAERQKLDAEGTDKIESKKRHNHITLLEWYGKYDYNNDGIMEECIFLVAAETRTLLSAKPLVTVSKIGKRPIALSQYIRRTNRLRGRGVPSLIKDLHKELDAIYNQKIDAGTMSIIPFGFYTPASGFKPEVQVLSPGTLFPVDDVNGVKFITVPNNTLASWQDIKFLEGLIEKITSISAYQMGRQSEIMGTKATATSTMALIKEGQTKFTVIGRRILQAVAKMLEMILEYYQQNIPPNLAYELLGEDGEQLFPEGLSPEEMMGKFTCSIALDTIAFTRELERQIDMNIYQIMIQNPLVSQSPARIWEITNDVLKSLGKQDTERIIGKKPEGEMIENGDAAQENMKMLQGYRVDPDPKENTVEHLLTHLAFKKSPAFTGMEPENKILLDHHILATKKLMELLAQQGIQPGQQLQQQGQQGPQPQQPQGPQPQGGGGQVAQQGGVQGVPANPAVGGASAPFGANQAPR